MMPMSIRSTSKKKIISIIAITLLLSQDNDDDAGIFSIANDYSSEDDETLAEENNVKSTVHTKRTGSNKAESTDDFC